MATRDKPFDDVLKATVSRCHPLSIQPTLIILKSTSTAAPCIAQKVIRKLQTQFAGTDQYEFQERVARDATGITYAGKLHIVFPYCVTHRLSCTVAAVDTVSME